MKTLYTLFFLLILAGGMMGFNPEKDKLGLCKVQKINGIEVYIMCEPINDYEMLGDAKNGWQTTSLLTGGIINESIADKISKFVKEAQKQHPTMDAVIYSAGKRIGAFRWSDGKPTGSKKGMATANKVDGRYAFIMSEPEADYMTLSTVSGGMKWKSGLTGGIANNSIEEDISRYMKRAVEHNPTLDAIIYNSGKSVATIKFEKSAKGAE